jgi:hypothetical protein
MICPMPAADNLRIEFPGTCESMICPMPAADNLRIEFLQKRPPARTQKSSRCWQLAGSSELSGSKPLRNCLHSRFWRSSACVGGLLSRLRRLCGGGLAAGYAGCGDLDATLTVLSRWYLRHLGLCGGRLRTTCQLPAAAVKRKKIHPEKIRMDG